MAGSTTFTLATFDRRRVMGLLATVPVERARLRRSLGLDWGRHLGTSVGSHTMGVDAGRWAWLCSWSDDAAAARFHDELAARLGPTELFTMHMRTVRARGRWAGHELAVAAGTHSDTDEPAPLVVLTRARVRPRSWRPFQGAVPAVDSVLLQAPGRLHSVGVGEWPVLVQGTVSVWRDEASMTAFARSGAHRIAVRRTAAEQWYAEELFARLRIVGAEGTWDGTSPI